MKLVMKAIASIALCSAAAAAHAQEPGSRMTREFIQSAAQSDEFEIMEATTALAQSQDPQVKAFATQMIEAHRGTSASLAAAIAKAGLAPPKPGINGDQSMFLASLQSQRGADFDKTYLLQQALAHRAALATEQGYAASGDNDAIKVVAATTVPLISSHLEMVEAMQR